MFSANRPPAQLLSDMWSLKTENCLVGSSVGGSLSFLVLLSLHHFCLFVPSLSALNWPLGPATVCRSSRGSLFIDQTYRPSPSDQSLTGYFTAQASFLPGGFFHALHALVFLPLSVFGCVSLGALCLPLGCTLPVIWVAGSLLAVSNRPAVHLCFYRTGLGPFFWWLCYSDALLDVANHTSPGSLHDQWFLPWPRLATYQYAGFCLTYRLPTSLSSAVLVSGVSRGSPSWPLFVPPFWSLSGGWSFFSHSYWGLPCPGFPTY